MSSLIAYSNNNQFVIATDTFVHSKDDNRIQPINFCCKTIYLPHHKSCVAGQGIGEVLNQFFLFVQQKVIAKDIYSLITQTTKHFKFNLDQNIEGDIIATLFVFGVNDLTNKLEVYKMSILKSNIHRQEQIEFGLLHKPEIFGIEGILDKARNQDIGQVLATLMKEQKKQDDLKPVYDKAGIGGQIQITTMIYNDTSKDLFLQIRMVDCFEDYEDIYYAMLNGT